MSLSISFTSTFLDKDFTQLYSSLCFRKKVKLWNGRFCDLTNVLAEAIFGGKRKIMEP